MAWLALLLIAWGALAFGSPYPWAYYPLICGATLVGAWGLISSRRVRTSRYLLISLLGLVFAVCLQLWPVDRPLLSIVSPNATRIVDQLELGATEQSGHALSIAPAQTRLGLMFLVSLAMLMVGVANALNRDTAQRLVSLIVVFGCLLALFGIVQNRVFNGQIYGFWSLTQGGTVFGPFINRNHFAGWMLLVIPLSLGQFMSRLSRRPSGPSSSSRLVWLLSEDGSKVTLSAFALLVMALSVALTMSRSGVAVVALFLPLGIIVMSRRLSPRPRAGLMYGYLVLILAGLIAWGSLDRIASRFASVGFAAMNERPAMWADALRMARDFWLTGAGLNTFGVGMIFYQTSVPDFHLHAAHNDYLQLMAEGGVLLGVPIVLVVVAFAHAARQRSRQDVGSIWWIRTGAILGLVSIGVQSIVEFSLQLPGNAVLFAVIAAIALHDGGHRNDSLPPVDRITLPTAN